jgi:hypothetical protein
MEVRVSLLLDKNKQDVGRGFQISSQSSCAYGVNFYAAAEKIWGSLARHGAGGGCEDR